MNELTISHLLSIRWILSKIANLISSHRSLLLPIMEQWDKLTLSNSNTRLLALMEGIRNIDNLRQCHLGLVLEYVLYFYSFMFGSLRIHIHSNNDIATVFKTNTRIWSLPPDTCAWDFFLVQKAIDKSCRFLKKGINHVRYFFFPYDIYQARPGCGEEDLPLYFYHLISATPSLNWFPSIPVTDVS